MKKSLLLAIAALALVGCSRHSLVTDPSEANGKLVPVEFSVQRQNMTKATNLEAVKHYNFGVFAYKVNGSSTSLADASSVPPVAMRSSMITTFWPSFIESTCISI